MNIETWQWVELTGYGDLPPPRDFAAGASVGNDSSCVCLTKQGKTFPASRGVLMSVLAFRS